MTSPLPATPVTAASPDVAAQFWVDALHELAQPVQALALFAERLRRLDVGPQAAPLVEHVGVGVQELQRVLQSLVQVAQRDADYWVAQPDPVDSVVPHVRGHGATQPPPSSQGQPPDFD